MLRSLQSVILLFLIVSLTCIIGKGQLLNLDVDPMVLLMGNSYVFLLTLFSFWLLSNGLKAKSTTSFMGSVYSSFMLKLVLSAILVVAYVRMSKVQANMPAIFISMFLYLVYTFLEVNELMKMLRKK